MLPTALSAPFTRAGYHLTSSEKARYTRALLDQFGGLAGAALLQAPFARRLLSDAKLRTGAACDVRHLLRVMRAGDNRAGALGTIAQFAAQGLLFRGVLARCPSCDYAGWYALEALREQMTCAGCRLPLQLPADKITFAYRLNHLWVQALNQGALSVLLAALHLAHAAEAEPLLWDSHWQVRHAGTKAGAITDIDLIALHGERLLVAECKDNFNPREQTAADWIAQLGALAAVARAVGAECWLVCLGAVPPEVQAAMRALNTADLTARVLLLDGG